MKKNKLKDKMIESGNIDPNQDSTATQQTVTDKALTYENIAKAIINGTNPIIKNGMVQLNNESSEICNDIINGQLTDPYELNSRTDILTLVGCDVMGEFVDEENLFNEVIKIVEGEIWDYYTMLHGHVKNYKLEIEEKIERYQKDPQIEFTNTVTKNKGKGK